MARYKVTVKKQRGCLGTMFVWFFGFLGVCLLLGFAVELLPLVIVGGIVYLIYRLVKKERQEKRDYKAGVDIDSDAYKYGSMTQDVQLKGDDSIDLLLSRIQNAEARYKETNDLDAYISFWENIWNHGGLPFHGVKWTFRLADLYIKAKRYDDALDFCRMIKRTRPNYSQKADEYIAKIQNRTNPKLSAAAFADRTEQTVNDCNTILDSTKSIPTFISRYKTLHDALSSLTATPAQTELARSEWQQALFYYPDRLHNVLDRAIADAYTLKTPRGQFNRFDRMIADLDTADAYTKEIRETIEMERMRLETLRDECVLHGDALDEPVPRETNANDNHVNF